MSVEVGILVAQGGHFYTTFDFLKAVKVKKDGDMVDLALFDGWLDPNYCRGHMVITCLRRRNRKTREIYGTIVYNGVPRRFAGTLRRYDAPLLKTDLSCTFKFTEPAAPL